MPTVPGCTEHHLKLSSILAEAREKHKSLAICWCDLANTYGSVHYSLIQFSLRHYHAHPQFLSVLRALYSGLNAKVITADWETPVVPLQMGVYQGDPLSVAIFNTVMNTLVDTLTTRIDLGYHLSGTSHQVNIMQYADDTCLVADSCQFLLSKVSDWIHWAEMRAKVPKCQSITLQASTSRLLDPQLHLDGAPIPFTSEPVKFLGMKIQAQKASSSPRESILASLQKMLEAGDTTPLTRRQKLLFYKAGVCPRLTWPLLIQEFSISWVEQQVDTMTTCYLKRWAGLTKSANTAILYLPHSMGGLNLPLPSILHKTLQVSRQSQLLTSRESCVRHLAERNLKCELTLTRKLFRPATAVRDILVDNPDHNRKSLRKVAISTVAEEANSTLLNKAT